MVSQRSFWDPAAGLRTDGRTDEQTETHLRFAIGISPSCVFVMFCQKRVADSTTNFKGPGQNIQGTLRPAQQEAGAGLAQGKLVRGTAQRSPSADRDSGDSEPESLWRA